MRLQSMCGESSAFAHAPCCTCFCAGHALAVHHADDTGDMHTSTGLRAQASRTTAEGLWVAVGCGAVVGVAMAAGAPLLVAVANTPPEVCWGQREPSSVVGYGQPVMKQGCVRLRLQCNECRHWTAGCVCCGDPALRAALCLALLCWRIIGPPA